MKTIEYAHITIHLKREDVEIMEQLKQLLNEENQSEIVRRGLKLLFEKVVKEGRENLT